MNNSYLPYPLYLANENKYTKFASPLPHLCLMNANHQKPVDQDSTIELEIAKFGQPVVELQRPQEFGCQTGIPEMVRWANVHAVAHLPATTVTWYDANRSSGCGVTASARIWVPMGILTRVRSAWRINDHDTAQDGSMELEMALGPVFVVLQHP